MRRSSRCCARALVLGLLSLVPAACEGDDGMGDEGDGAAPHFPEDYEESYVEVRDCRGSGDHALNNIRILVDPGSAEAYQGRSVPFAENAVVLKAEYDFGDATCSGEPKQWTVMRKLADGSSPDTLGWSWQTVDDARVVVADDASGNTAACVGCHQACGMAPDGYDWTCALPE
jgi:hypothetical protein